jgi:hypothetical protein
MAWIGRRRAGTVQSSVMVLAAIDINTVLAAGALVVSVIAGLLAYLQWRRPRHPRETLPRFGDWDAPTRLGHQEQSREFTRFLDANTGGKVFINAWFDPSEFPDVHPEGEWLAARAFTMRDDSVRHAEDQAIYIRVDDPRSSQLTYSGGGGWHLKGYFAVDGIVAVKQGITMRAIVPIPLEHAVA